MLNITEDEFLNAAEYAGVNWAVAEGMLRKLKESKETEPPQLLNKGSVSGSVCKELLEQMLKEAMKNYDDENESYIGKVMAKRRYRSLTHVLSLIEKPPTEPNVLNMEDVLTTMPFTGECEMNLKRICLPRSLLRKNQDCYLMRAASLWKG